MSKNIDKTYIEKRLKEEKEGVSGLLKKVHRHFKSKSDERVALSAIDNIEDYFNKHFDPVEITTKHQERWNQSGQRLGPSAYERGSKKLNESIKTLRETFKKFEAAREKYLSTKSQINLYELLLSEFDFEETYYDMINVRDYPLNYGLYLGRGL